MTKMVRTLTETDKVLLRATLLNAGIKARVRSFRRSIRVVFEGQPADVCDALNGEGFLNACGEQFTRFSFNGPNEVFVYYTRP